MAASSAEQCILNRAELLAMDEQSFDQDMQGGWRAIAARDECMGAAADLVRDYRQARGSTSATLYWHEGQLRALIGESDKAIQLLDRARHDHDELLGWNLYVDATIAFLRHDRAALVSARDALARVPRPEDFAVRDPWGQAIPWPINLNIVDALIKCFDREYKAAYGCVH